MCYIKARHFFSPPMTESDFALLLLRKPDGTATEVPEPASQPTADLSFPGVHLVELNRIHPVDGTASDPRSAYGVQIHWGLSGEPTAMNKFRVTGEPKTGWDLPNSLFMRRNGNASTLRGRAAIACTSA
jgi:hypothetical protein